MAESMTTNCTQNMNITIEVAMIKAKNLKESSGWCGNDCI